MVPGTKITKSGATGCSLKDDLPLASKEPHSFNSRVQERHATLASGEQQSFSSRVQERCRGRF